ncbi:SHR3 [Cyberlindnera jadinii]|uniref:SHR3 protein n=1 Tax=Cyberlindnera jadinii (strain ATCC 18201 / CBS 1600 / BCRC 20928 / JCM 3617 / NBRC 0987 / NRRL Y-1542) TaxID=983966 RepID=A0A0H5C2K5_CYBJN|nr:SHR3 [Cyberlindnera jadinii]
MVAIRYKDLVPLGTALTIAGSFFFMGVILGNLPYDFKTLYSPGATQADFDNSLRHYQTWAEIPTVALHILHFFIGIGFVGMLIKIYKPDDEIKYFEYGSLVLYVIAVCTYLTNLKIGAQSAVHGEWGDVDQNTGINVIAATETLIVFLLGFIVVLQLGLYWAQVDYQQRLEIFNKELAEEAKAEEEKIQETAKSTGVKAKKTTMKSTSKKN